MPHWQSGMGPRTDAKPVSAGLCETCVWARRIQNDRGSVFLLCRRSFEDPNYRKYPPLPVLRCPGYEAQPPDSASNEK